MTSNKRIEKVLLLNRMCSPIETVDSLGKYVTHIETGMNP